MGWCGGFMGTAGDGSPAEVFVVIFFFGNTSPKSMATRRWLGVSPIYKEHTLIPLIYGQGMDICRVQLRIYKGGIRVVIAPYSTPGGSGRSRGGTINAGICRKRCKKAMEPVIHTAPRKSS